VCCILGNVVIEEKGPSDEFFEGKYEDGDESAPGSDESGESNRRDSHLV
jgi:hypothetical protein